MIIFMLWSHSWKCFCDLSDYYHATFPVFFHRYTLGFVGISGIALYLLRNKLTTNNSLGRYCLKRGVRLFLLCLFIAIFLRPAFSYNIALLNFNDLSTSIASFFVSGRSFGFESFVARIAMFVILAGLLIKNESRTTLITCSCCLCILFVLRTYTYIAETESELNAYNYILYDIDLLLQSIFAGVVGICIGILIENKRYLPSFVTKSFPYLCVLGVPFLLSYQHLLKLPYLADVVSAFFRISFAACLGMLIVKSLPERISKLICIVGIYSLFVYIAHWELGFFVKQFLEKKELLGLHSIGNFACASLCFMFLGCSMWLLILLRMRNKSLDIALRRELGL